MEEESKKERPRDHCGEGKPDDDHGQREDRRHEREGMRVGHERVSHETTTGRRRDQRDDGYDPDWHHFREVSRFLPEDEVDDAEADGIS